MAKQRFEDGDLWVDIDLDLCTGAGECVDVCPEDVYEIVDGKVTVPKIGDCSECAIQCPNGVKVQARMVRAQELLA